MTAPTNEPPRSTKHVVVSGNIGAGKTALTKVIGEYFDWTTVYEEVDDNPYLGDFYEDMRRWSFNLQVFFLSKRFEQIQEIEEMDASVVQDRSIYEDAHIFARNLYEMEHMSARDYRNYTDLFSIMTTHLTPPSLLIYLRASVPTLVNQIRKRGREFESTIRIDYLERLQGHYEEWIESYDRGPKLIIDTDELDFVDEAEDRRVVLNQIESRLFGLFPDEDA
jgi:deoxyadenosine/deoxycytidine kinase